MTTTTDLPYSVCEWGSHPDEDNDDCWCGSDLASEAEAREELARVLAREEKLRGNGGTAYVVLDGPGVHQVVAVRAYHTKRAKRRRAAQAFADRAERAMQAGMGLGAQAYNDAMGW